MKPVIQYECEYCHKQHPDIEEAKGCEATCKNKIEENKINKIFLNFFKAKIGKYEIRCSDCDKVVIEYDVDRSDPHRNERGKCIKNEKPMVMLDAYFCRDCYKAKRKFLADAIVAHQERNKQ
jgi:hypothetical protein